MDQAIDLGAQGNEASARSQARIDSLDDETEALLQRYRGELSQIDSLKVYNAQLEQLLESQAAERASLLEQMNEVEIVGRGITPLLIDMIESLDAFIALDLPFLLEERRARVAGLREMMGRSDVADSEKYRRILEAFQIEDEFGHTIGAYEGRVEIGGRTLLVDFLRFGRLALAFQSRDGRVTGAWRTGADGGGRWVELGGEYRSAIREGLRIASDRKAPDLVFLPVPAPVDAR